MSDGTRHRTRLRPDSPAGAAPPPEDRRGAILRRNRQIRNVGVAGAVAALGVFTGLAATGSQGSSAQPAQQAAPSAQGSVDTTIDPLSQNDFLGSGGGVGGFSGGGPGIAPSSGGAPSMMSGGS